MLVERTITIENSGASAIRVWVEPWGDFVDLAPTESIRLSSRSTSAGEFHLEHAPQEVKVWAWSGSSVRVVDVQSGKELKPGSFAIPAPFSPRSAR